jgi:multidrug efflux pump subunit AcrB
MLFRKFFEPNQFIKSMGTCRSLFVFSYYGRASWQKEELENLVVSNNGKGIITLKDIASVEIKEAKEVYKSKCKWKKVFWLQ